MSEQVIEVRKREELGGSANRKLRNSGMIPAVVYGAGRDNVPISVDRRSVLDLLRGGAGENAVFLLKMAGTKQERHAMVRELQVDPITREIIHMDFLRVVMTEKLQVEVPVQLVGEPVGVIQDGGVVDFVRREVEVECLPADIPDQLAVDVSELYIGQHVAAQDLQLPDGVELTEEPDRVIASVVAPRALEEELEEEEELLLEAEPDEPEVIGRGKAEEEEEEGEAEEES